MNDKRLRIPFSAPLSQMDTETQTYGCRANNPDICANSDAPTICAFVNQDGICRKSSKAWKKKYNELKKG